jgi:hypothetical protein
VTSLRDELQAQLQHFDDEAFAALANRGLLRRAQKDLEKAAPELATEGAEELVLRVGEHRVTFDRRGPAHARCSCPATTICQHVLTAALTLQRLPHSTTGPQAPRDLHALLMAIPVAALAEHAGKAGLRWAVQFALDLDLLRDVQVATDKGIVITFRQPRFTARYAGGDVASFVLDADFAAPAKYRAAAVLTYQRAHGMAPTAPAPTAARLDLGSDFTPPPAAEAAREEARRRLRAAFCQLACECLELGLSHLSEHVQQRFATLAVSAQGAEYPRLARLLRRIADHVELLLDRIAGADEHRLFDELALTFGLATALEAAAREGRQPTHLVGTARSRYDETATLELLGLGAHAWRSPAGYTGLTMLFWSPADATFLSCTDARPTSLRGFDPIVRYTQPGPWTGLGAPQLATGRHIALTGAETNEQGRLAAAERTHATIRPCPDLATLLRPVSRWRDLLATHGGQRQSLLAEPQPMLDWTVLRPDRFEPCHFDRTRQTFVWPLVDDEGDVFTAELTWARTTQHAIARLEQEATSLAPGTLVVARLSRSGGRVVAEPLSLVRAPDTAADNPVDALHFDAPRGKGEQAAPRDMEPPTAEATPTPTSGPSPSGLETLRSWLRRHAERGLPPERVAAARLELAALVRDAQTRGFTVFPEVVPAEVSGGEMLLRMGYLCLQYGRLSEGTEEGEAG